METEYLSEREFAQYANEIRTIVHEALQRRTLLPSKRIGIFNPRSPIGYYFPPKRLSTKRYTRGIPFGRGDFSGVIVLSRRRRPLIAVPLRKGSWYRTLDIETYVRYYLAFGKYSHRSTAESNIKSAKWYLGQLLSAGHPLKMTSFDDDSAGEASNAESQFAPSGVTQQ